ncbi:MAG: hypothetical protein Q7T63_22200 [Burkholderiaceae bacterium]|nr:hypothetical protein [Burkholderiaceae bacterium]
MSSVTPISAARTARSSALADPMYSVSAPIPLTGTARLDSEIAKAGLTSDARALWLAYPNLHDAACRLLEMLSTEWPSSRVPKASAAVQAVITAISRVKEGFSQQETSREMIVANFLHGIASVADDVAGVTAWGFNKEKPVEQFDVGTSNFDVWSSNQAFTEIRFFFAENRSSSEVEGTRLKVLCAVASARDVGVAARFKK